MFLIEAKEVKELENEDDIEKALIKDIGYESDGGNSNEEDNYNGTYEEVKNQANVHRSLTQDNYFSPNKNLDEED